MKINGRYEFFGRFVEFIVFGVKTALGHGSFVPGRWALRGTSAARKINFFRGNFSCSRNCFTTFCGFLPPVLLRREWALPSASFPSPPRAQPTFEILLTFSNYLYASLAIWKVFVGMEINKRRLQIQVPVRTSYRYFAVQKKIQGKIGKLRKLAWKKRRKKIIVVDISVQVESRNIWKRANLTHFKHMHKTKHEIDHKNAIILHKSREHHELKRARKIRNRERGNKRGFYAKYPNVPLLG